MMHEIRIRHEHAVALSLPQTEVQDCQYGKITKKNFKKRSPTKPTRRNELNELLGKLAINPGRHRHTQIEKFAIVCIEAKLQFLTERFDDF